MRRGLATLTIEAQWAAGVVACVLAIGLGVWTVNNAHAARRARHLVCEARLDALRARNPFVQHYVRPADPCLALEVLTAVTR